ncbi:MAG: type IX secretion system membrane protein PorP/SprF [Saprospiraceae bacterium]|nr:type IX secretion system membrane protein PorP/SprF [Saprospiraceae bacterium]
MKKAFFTLFFGLMVLAAFAQEQAIYSQYHIFPVLTNPAATAFDNKFQVLGNARSTWTGFPGKPTSYTLLASAPVGDKLALGGGLFTEKIGDLRTSRLQLNYAFRFKVQKARISLGLSTEFLNKRADNELLTNQLVDPNDPVVENMTEGQSIFDASMGVHMLYDERFFASLALPNTIRTRLDEVPTANTENSSGSLFNHYMFQMGYIADVASQNFKVIPSISMRKFRDTPYQIDLNVQGRFLEEKLIAGLTFRPSYGGTATFLLGSKYNNLEVYYSYDVAFSDFQAYNGGSHELSVAYNIPRRTQKPVTTDPATDFK